MDGSLGEDEIDDLVQDCINSSALAMELLQSCTKPSQITVHHTPWNEIDLCGINRYTFISYITALYYIPQHIVELTFSINL